MLCGVLRCFAVFYVRVFSVFYETAQNRPKSMQNAQNEQNTLCAIQRNTVLCILLSLRKRLQKNSQNTSKTLQNIRKTPQNTVFQKKHSQNTTKHPQNTCKTPQNTANHHKTHLLTKQTELANKPLRSRRRHHRWRASRRRASTTVTARRCAQPPGLGAPAHGRHLARAHVPHGSPANRDQPR